MNTRHFWLLSDNKTVREVDHITIRHVLKRSHVIFIHPNGELYTNRNVIPAKQFRQILELCFKDKGAVFIEHIRKHLSPEQDVICKICGRTVEQIYVEYRKEITEKGGEV